MERSFLKVSVLLKVSRLCLPDSCPAPRAGIVGQHPQLSPGQLSRGAKATAFSVLHGDTKAEKKAKKKAKNIILSVQSKPHRPNLRRPGSGVCTCRLPGASLIPSLAEPAQHRVQPTFPALVLLSMPCSNPPEILQERSWK